MRLIESISEHIEKINKGITDMIEERKIYTYHTV